jgi:DNA-binding response OmpR family regulator
MQFASTQSGNKKAIKKPTVLIVEDEPSMLELTADLCRSAVDAKVLQATSLKEAARLLDRETVQLIIADVKLPDGDGTSLINLLSEKQPEAQLVVITGDASMQQSVECFRNGAVDYIAKPFSATQFSDRISKALSYQSQVVRTEKRLVRLKSAVKKLNNARHMVSKKVDLLCNDLVNAYGDLARQFEEVRVREAFRKTVNASHDLEQMLCHTMDWLLKQCGYTNIAIYLAGDDGVFDLGAYMKYTVQGSKMLTDALNHGVQEAILREEFVFWTAEEAAENLTPTELDFIPGNGVMGVNCTYLGESLGTIIMFRDGKSPFTNDDQATLRSVASIFAHALTTLARKEDAMDDETGENMDDEDNFQAGLDDIGDLPEKQNESPFYDDEPKKPKKKKDDADWWKRGEPPPF